MEKGGLGLSLVSIPLMIGGLLGCQATSNSEINFAQINAPAIVEPVIRAQPLLYGYAPDQNSIDFSRHPLNKELYPASHIVNFFSGAEDNIDLNMYAVEQVIRDGKIPMLSIRPATSMREYMNDKNAIHIRENVRRLKNLKKPILLRFAYEMNGDWFEYGGNPDEFKKGWKFFTNIVREEEAENVQMVWCADVSSNFEEYFPGDEWVDFVALDGYNKHVSSVTDPKYWIFPDRDFDNLFTEPITRLEGLSSKPIIITEIGTADEANAKKWMEDAILNLEKNPRVWAVMFFAWDKRDLDPLREAQWGTILDQIDVYRLTEPVK